MHCRPETRPMPAIMPAPGTSLIVHVAGGELADLEERRAGIEQALDPVAGKQLAARHMALAMLLGPALRSFGDVVTQLLDKGTVMRERAAVFGAVGADVCLKLRCAHALCMPVGRITLPLA